MIMIKFDKHGKVCRRRVAGAIDLSGGTRDSKCQRGNPRPKVIDLSGETQDSKCQHYPLLYILIYDQMIIPACMPHIKIKN